MQFNLLYQFLAKRTFKPTTKAKCRLYMAKDLKSYSARYYNIMHQLIGARWNPLLQNLAYDAFLLKKLAKLIITIIIIALFFYTYIF